MNMFIVYKQGVYRHEISGVFSTLELAKKAATLGALSEYDGYHHFTVAKVGLDETVEDVADLFSVSSNNHVKEKCPDWTKYDPRPLSRDIVVINNDREVIEVLIQMTRELEIVK